MDTAKVAVIASNHLIRTGIQALLCNTNSDFEFTGAFFSIADYEKHLKQTKQQLPILLLDDSASSTKSILLVRRLLQHYPHLKIVVMSDFLNEMYIQRLMNSGVKGFLYMQDHLDDILVPCFRTVAGGYPFLSPQASALPYHRMAGQSFNKTDLAVLELMGMGYKPQEIAARLNIVPRTVYRIRRKLRDCLNVRTPEQIVEAAREQGLLRAAL
jgi:DNA-binding NarL/FixJ family response regulator